MTDNMVSRRALMQGVAAAGTAALMPGHLLAQQAGVTATAPGAPLPQRAELLIRGATVLTVDPKVGDFTRGDVHVRDGAIVAVAENVNAAGLTVLDADRHDLHARLHRHPLAPVDKRVPPDHPHRRSQAHLLPGDDALGRHFAPEDSYRSVRLGLAEGLRAGATTVHNWAHNIRSPEHADAELRACATPACAAASPTARPVALPTRNPWISPASPASSANGCPTTAR